MKQIIKIFVACIAASVAMCGCNDLKEVNERIEDLQSRVSALETQITSLNGNVEALKVLAGGGTIKSIEQQGDTYVIVTSNGTTLTLKQGSIGIGNAPIMSIDKDGYWMVDYQDGKGAQYILSNGEKVFAIGQDGISPKFGVDSENYWTVSYDGGDTFSRVLNQDGQPVKAIPEGEARDSYFKDVKVEDSCLVLTLVNGDVYSVPVISDFYCIIDNDKEIVEFKYDEAKAYDVDMKGVASALVTAPTGWDASLSDSKLKIIAPSEPTKASVTIADSRTDVSILALSASGYSTIATVRVKISGSPTKDVPVATVKGADVTVSSVSFKVDVEDATEWYSLVLPSSAVTPAISDMMSKGTKHTGSSETVTFEGTEESSTYHCYVLPVNGDILGSIVCGIATSAQYDDRFAAYNSGKKIMVGSTAVDKATYGEAVHLTANATLPLDAKGVYFVDKDVVIDHSAATRPKGSVIIVNNTPGTRGKILFGNTIIPQVANVDILINGMEIAINKNAFTYGSATNTVHKLGFYDCKLDINANYFSATATLPMYNTEVIGCDIKTTIADFGIHDGSKGLNKFETIIFNNNIVYAATTGTFRIFRQGRASIKDAAGRVEIKNNTFYNITFSNGLCSPASVDAFYMESNIFAYSAANTSYQRCLWISTDDDKTGKTAPVAGYPAEGRIVNNIRYNSQRVLGCMVPAERLGDKAWYATDYKEIVDAAENPFSTADVATGVFVKKADFASYGAQR